MPLFAVPPSAPENRPSRRRKILLTAAGLLALFVVLAGAAAAVVQGPRLGRLVTQTLGKLGLAGRIEVGSLWLRPRLLWDLVTDTPTPVALENVSIDDPDGTRVLTLSRLDLKIPLRSAIAGKVRLFDVVIGRGSYWRFGDTKDGTRIGFLAALIPPPVPPPPGALPPPPAAAESTFLLELVNVTLAGLTAEFDFPGAWGLRLADVFGNASVIIDGDFVGWDATKLHAREGGFLRILDSEVLPFDDVRVARVATTRDWPNDIFLEVEAGRTGKSILTGKGYFTHIYDDGPPGIDLRAAFAHAGDALAAVAAGHAIAGLSVSGEDATVALELTKPFAEIEVAAAVKDLQVGYAGGRAENLDLNLVFSAAEPMTVNVPRLSFRVPEGGGVSMSARLEGSKASATIDLENVDNRAFVPDGLRKLATATIDGRLAASFDLEKAAGRLELKQLFVQRAHGEGLPRHITLNGRVVGSPERLDAHDLRVSIPGADAHIQGRVEIGKQLLALSLAAAARDLPQALAFLNPPAQVPRAATLGVQVNGSFTNPFVRGELKAQGVQVLEGEPLPEVSARFSLKDGVAHLHALEGELFGGSVEVQGRARLYRRSIENMLEVPILDLRAQGESLDLGQILSIPEVAGRLSFRGWAKGPLSRLEGELSLPAGTRVELLGQSFRIDGFAVQIDPSAITLRSTELVRARGGRLRLEGRLSLLRGQDMRWTIALDELPLADLPGVDPASLPPLSGSVSADLTLSGSPSKPQLAGQLRLANVTFDQRSLGNAVLDFVGHPEGGTRMSGRLFDRFDATALVTLPKQGPHVEAELGFRELSLQGLAPDVADRIGFNGQSTGSVKLLLEPGKPLAVDVRLEDLKLTSRPRNDLLGGGPPLEVRTEGPLIAHLRGDLMDLEITKLQTTGGGIELGGRLRGEELEHVVVRGQLDLALLAPALSPFVQRSEGNLTLALRATGPVSRPRVDGHLTVTRPIELLLPALDIPVAVPSGRVRITPKDVDLQKLVVQMGSSKVLLQGRAAFDENYQITRFGIGIDGEVDAKLLPLLAPQSITEADGKLELRGRLGGTPSKPDFDAKVLVKDVGLRLRDVGHSLRVRKATLAVTPKEARIEELEATVDDQGSITIGGQGQEAGRLVFEQILPELKVKYARLPVRGERLVYRSPGVFALDDLGFSLELEGDLHEQLSLRGDVRVVTGRFTQDVAIRDMAISSRLQGESYGRPQPNPLIDNMRLDLRVRTIGDTFLIQNNLSPEMYAVVDLHVGGTPIEPQLDGSILPTDGRFKIPGTGLRGYFDLVPNVNSIVFVGTKELGETTPELSMEAESLVTDVDGQEHNVRMRIRGPINQAEITFSSTDTGLNQNETLLLLLSGRASTSSVRFGTSSANLGRNLDTGFQMAGNVTRDLVDNLLQPYISDTLSLITGDKLQLRPTVGPDGVEVRVFGRAGRYLRLQLNYLQGFQGQRQARSEGRVWLADFFLFRTFAEYLELPQQGITETSRSLNLELFVEWPVRFDLP